MGSSSAFEGIGRAIAGVATFGASEFANEVSGGALYGEKSTAAYGLGLTGGDDGGGSKSAMVANPQDAGNNGGGDGDSAGGKSGTAEGGEDVYSSGAMAMRKKKSTLIGSGDDTFTSTLGS